ncbi:MAG: hypothetical protein Q4C54_09130 [Clostridia bacterium]|nr:hypothetical protein [Clostridia bacterium]
MNEQEILTAPDWTEDMAEDMEEAADSVITCTADGRRLDVLLA